MTALCSVVLLITVAAGPAPAAKSAPPVDIAILAGKIVPVEKPVIDHGVLLVGGGKIVEMGTRDKVTIPETARVIDVGARWVMPGIVEAHTHVGLDSGYDLGLNDMVYPVNPDLRVGDVINFEAEAVKAALAEGVTTINTMPGSGTNHAGYSVIIKTGGADLQKRIVRDPGCMKIAQAFNPERDTDDMGGTRMGMAYLLRRHLREGKAYAEAWREYEQGKRAEKPALRRELERIRLVFEGKIPVINHTYSGWGVAESIRLFSEEFGLDLIATHTAYAGYNVGEYAAKRPTKVHINIGPRLVEYRRSPDGTIKNMASEYYKRGVRNLSINTDAVMFAYSRLSPQHHLFYQATMSARHGLQEQAAVRAITFVPAQALNIADRVGSLKVGKDADILIKGGTLLDVTAPVDMVLIDGTVVYERTGSGITIREPVEASPSEKGSGQDSRPPTGKEWGDASGQPGLRHGVDNPGVPASSSDAGPAISTARQRGRL